MKNLILIADGGHSKVIQSIVNNFSDYVITEIWDQKYNTPFRKKNILYKNIDRSSSQLADKTTYFFIAVGDNHLRKHIAEQLNCDPSKFATLKHPTAVIDPGIHVSPGCIIMPGAIIQHGSYIGTHTIINTGAVIEHDCVINDYVHIAPSSTLTGGCKVGYSTLIGASSVLIPQIVVGDDVVIGAGSVVTKNIESHQKAFGNPARIINK